MIKNGEVRSEGGICEVSLDIRRYTPLRAGKKANTKVCYI